MKSFAALSPALAAARVVTRVRALSAVLLALVMHLAPAMAIGADAVDEAIGSRVDRVHAASGGEALVRPATFERAVAAFYERRGFVKAWIGHPDRLRALHDALDGLRFDGLRPEDYGFGLTDPSAPESPGPAGTLAERDWAITQGFLKALLHLYRGKLDPRAVDAIWNVDRRAVDVQQGMSAAIEAVEEGDIGALFAAARPQHPLYGGLRDALRELLRIADAAGWPAIPGGPTLDAAHADARIPVLRRRLEMAGYETGPADTGDDLFDPALESAVRAFQEEQGLVVDGRVGPATRAALNVPVEKRIDQVRANLERARWLLHDLPGDFVLVDIAGYRVHYIRDGRPIFTSRIQVGQPDRRTPIFRADISHLTIDPQWIVPPTILQKDILPALREDRDYLEKHRLRAFDTDDREVDARGIDWHNAHGVILRQDPGPDGALGRIAIRFPNRYAIYLHETPHTALFSSARRAFSSGCIRVEHPFDLAALLMEGDPAWNRDTLESAAAGGQTLTVPLPRTVPILLMYWTVDRNAGGRLSFKPDVYGLDAPTLRALDVDAVEVASSSPGLLP